MARWYDARITDVVMYDLAMSALDVAAMKKRSLEALQQLLTADVRTYCSVETLVTEGRPAREILKAATARAGRRDRHGRPGAERPRPNGFRLEYPRGNSGHDCPVLTVRCPRESAVSAS